MHYVLFILFTASSGSGPTMPIMQTADFTSLAACESAGKQMDEFTRGDRVLYSRVKWKCFPKADAAVAAPAPQ